MAKYLQEFEQLLVHTGQHYDDNMSLDTLLHRKERVLALDVLEKYGAESPDFALLTLCY